MSQDFNYRSDHQSDQLYCSYYVSITSAQESLMSLHVERVLSSLELPSGRRLYLALFTGDVANVGILWTGWQIPSTTLTHLRHSSRASLERTTCIMNMPNPWKLVRMIKKAWRVAETAIFGMLVVDAKPTPQPKPSSGNRAALILICNLSAYLSLTLHPCSWESFILTRCNLAQATMKKIQFKI